MSDLERNGSNLPALNADRGTHGELILYKDRQHLLQDGTAMPPDWQSLVIGMARVIQFWQGGRPDPSKDIVEQPGQEFTDADVAALNDKVPKAQWELDLNGQPKPPFSLAYAVYLFDPKDAQIYTHINSTNGQRVAFIKLHERIELMRAFRGETVAPIVTLGEKLFSKRFGKYRAEFVIVEWRRPHGKTGEPKRLEKSPSGFIGEKVEEPSLKETLNDEVPYLG
jgi:hypothetical protein